MFAATLIAFSLRFSLHLAQGTEREKRLSINVRQPGSPFLFSLLFHVILFIQGDRNAAVSFIAPDTHFSDLILSTPAALWEGERE